MLAASEGLHKDMEVVATGSGITVPVGQGTLGRLFNVDVYKRQCNVFSLRSIGDRWCMVVVSSCREMLG